MTNSDNPIYETADGQFALYEDGSWDALQDGRLVFSGAFDRREMYALSEELLRVAHTRINMGNNDRYGDQ